MTSLNLGLDPASPEIQTLEASIKAHIEEELGLKLEDDQLVKYIV